MSQERSLQDVTRFVSVFPLAGSGCFMGLIDLTTAHADTLERIRDRL